MLEHLFVTTANLEVINQRRGGEGRRDREREREIGLDEQVKKPLES